MKPGKVTGEDNLREKVRLGLREVASRGAVPLEASVVQRDVEVSAGDQELA